jgi:hypothetical protein
MLTVGTYWLSNQGLPFVLIRIRINRMLKWNGGIDILKVGSEDKKYKLLLKIIDSSTHL